MTVKNTIKFIVGFIVGNCFYDKNSFKRELEKIKLQAQLAIKDFVKEAPPPEKPVYVVLIPKGILGNIWEFNSVHGTIEDAQKRVEKIISDNPILHKNYGKVRHYQNGNHLNYELYTKDGTQSFAVINTYYLK